MSASELANQHKKIPTVNIDSFSQLMGVINVCRNIRNVWIFTKMK